MSQSFTTENIILALQARWTDRVGGEEVSKMNAGTIKDIAEELDCYNDEAKKQLFDYLKGQKYAPRLHSVLKGAEVLGLTKTSSRGFKVESVYQCSECETYYSQVNDSLAAYCCPKCGSLERSLSEHPGNKDVVYFNEYCVINQHGKKTCGYLTQKMTSRTNGINCDCKEYGTGSRLAKCNDCQCQECCEYAKQNKGEIRVDITAFFSKMREDFKSKIKKV